MNTYLARTGSNSSCFLAIKQKGQVPVHAITDKKEIDCFEGN